MTHLPIVPQTDLQRLLVEQALALAQQLEQAAATAPHGGILDRCELATLHQGRQSLQGALAAALRQQIRQGETRGRPPASAPVAKRGKTKVPTRAK